MTDAAALFPADVSELTPEILTASLAARTPGARIEAFQIAEVKYAGEGVASTADRVVLEVEWAQGSPPNLPSRLVLKTMLVGPHALPEMYETETRFYADIQPETEVESPRAFGCHFGGGNGNFGLLMEDLGERDASFPSAVSEVPTEAIRSLLGELALLHATYWESPRFGADLAWIPTPVEGGMQSIFTQFGYDFAQSQVDLHPFKQELIAPLGMDVRGLWDRLARVREEHARRPPTLLHGDTHIGNTFLLPGNRGGWLDWQLMTRGCFAADVIYLLVTGLPTEARRRDQEELLRFYLDALGRAGVAHPPGYQETFELCRRAALWGLVIGWLLCPPANYGEAITVENIRRTVAAVEDLDTLAAIG